MKRAVIATGSKQFLVTEGEIIEVELLDATSKTVTFEPLLVVDGDKVDVGSPSVKTAKVTAEVLEADQKDDKVYGVRFKAKKRVKTSLNHRQHKTVLKITKIS